MTFPTTCYETSIIHVHRNTRLISKQPSWLLRWSFILRWNPMDTKRDHDRDHGDSNRLYTLQGSSTVPTRREDHPTHATRDAAQEGTHVNLSPTRSRTVGQSSWCRDTTSPSDPWILLDHPYPRLHTMRSWPKRQYEMRYLVCITIRLDMWYERIMLRPTNNNGGSLIDQSGLPPIPLSVCKLTFSCSSFP